MLTTTSKERLKEAEEFAKSNNGIIDHNIFVDIMKAYNNDITEAELAEAEYSMDKKGLRIDFGSDEDGYKDDNSNQERMFIPADVNIKSQTLSLDLIVNRLQNKEIKLRDVEFQRNPDLWDEGKQSRLIESLMLQIPIPSFYFDVSDDSSWIVIDGLQRLSAIKNFLVDKSLTLTQLDYLKDFNGSKFDELPRQYIRRINETQILMYTVQKGTPINVVYNIFKRLNTGGLVLNSQEIRHALNPGKALNLIKRMAESEEFKQCTEYAIKSSRMQDQEYATRYIAFTKYGIDKYRGNIDIFLNEALGMVNHMDPKTIGDFINKTLAKFKNTMEYCYRIFGAYAFRRVSEKRVRGPVNKALFDAFSLAVSDADFEVLDRLVNHCDMVREEYITFINDPEFLSYIKSGDKNSVQKRIDYTYEFIRRLSSAK